MQKQHVHLKWKWELTASPEKLWPLVADTNRLFKTIKLPAVQLTDISYNVEESYLQLSYDSIKYSDAWIEEPFEWEYPFRYGVKRQYKNGSYKEITLRVDLHPYKKGTRLQYQLWITRRSTLFFFFNILKLKTIVRARLKNFFKTCDGLSGKNIHPYRLEPRKTLPSGAQKRIDQIKLPLEHETGEKTIVRHLLNFIQRADDIDLQHIDPYHLAPQWNAQPNEVLHVFLYAVKEGLLNFNWNLYCPDCRTIQQTCKTLNEIHEPIFCDECKKRFQVNFNRSVQLSFRPNPLIRKISDKRYSLAGPQESPHKVIQQLIKPGQTRYIKTRLEDGIYYLHTSDSQGRATIHVQDEGDVTVQVSLTDQGMYGEANIINEPNLIFKNETRKDQLFILEKSEWNQGVVTAAQVTSLQTFRDLFAHEVLRKGEKIAVNELTLMFTDLYDSTSMYHEEGDDHAVSQVIEHFNVLQQAVAQEDGALVKTIGDSIMAVFSSPCQAFKAFINAQKIISEDRKFKKMLKLKAGIHHGSCVAVNLNNKIDYFGSTVNMASRLVDLANENEVIIPESVSRHSEIDQMLATTLNQCTVKKEHAHLKGFENEKFVLRRIRMEQTALRLVI